MLSQFESLYLARLSLWQSVDKLDRARIFVRRYDCLHVILQPLHARGVTFDTSLQYNVRSDDLPTVDIRTPRSAARARSTATCASGLALV